MKHSFSFFEDTSSFRSSSNFWLLLSLLQGQTLDIPQGSSLSLLLSAFYLCTPKYCLLSCLILPSADNFQICMSVHSWTLNRHLKFNTLKNRYHNLSSKNFSFPYISHLNNQHHFPSCWITYINNKVNLTLTFKRIGPVPWKLVHWNLIYQQDNLPKTNSTMSNLQNFVIPFNNLFFTSTVHMHYKNYKIHSILYIVLYNRAGNKNYSYFHHP